VLAILAGAVLADLAWCNGGVALVGTLAAIADRLTNETAALAGKRLGAAALEQADPGRGHRRRTRLAAVVVEKIKPVSADTAHVTRNNPSAEVTAAM